MKVTLKGSHLMFACVLPHNHPLLSAEFPEYSEVVRNSEDRGETREETLMENIADVTLGDFYRNFIESGGRVTWVAIKPGERNGRMYIFLSKYNKRLELRPAQQAIIDALIAETWGWARITKIHNTKTVDLTTIEVVKASGKKRPRNSFDFKGDDVVLSEVKHQKLADKKQRRGESHSMSQAQINSDIDCDEPNPSHQ